MIVDIAAERRKITIFDPQEQEYCSGLLDVIEQLQAENKKLRQYRDYVETRISECKIPDEYLPLCFLCFEEWDKAVKDLANDLEEFLKGK